MADDDVLESVEASVDASLANTVVGAAAAVAGGMGEEAEEEEEGAGRTKSLLESSPSSSEESTPTKELVEQVSNCRSSSSFRPCKQKELAGFFFWRRCCEIRVYCFLPDSEL